MKPKSKILMWELDSFENYEGNGLVVVLSLNGKITYIYLFNPFTTRRVDNDTRGY